MSIKSKTNVWNFADEDDADGLRKAMRLVPSSANILGWSYLGGRRRGVRWNEVSHAYEISSAPDARPATILHIACVNGSIKVATMALSHGALVSTILGTPGDQVQIAVGDSARIDALTIASANHDAGLNSDEFLELIELAVHRTTDGCGRLIEEEALIRRTIETMQQSQFERLTQHAKDGVIELQVETRGLNFDPEDVKKAPTSSDIPETPNTGSQPSDADPKLNANGNMSFVVMVPRCSTKKQLQAIVDRLVGQSTSICFTVSERVLKEEELSTSIHNDDEDVSSSNNNNKSNKRVVELSSRNIHLLLCRSSKARCIARPLLLPVKPTDDPSQFLPKKAKKAAAEDEQEEGADDSAMLNSTYNAADVSKLLGELRASRSRNGSPAPRSNSAMGGPVPGGYVDQLKDMVSQYELSTLNSTSMLSTKLLRKVISQESEEAVIGRLYGRVVTPLLQATKDREAYIVEGASRLVRLGKKGLTPELEESVQRLCYEGMAKKAAKVADLEQALMATVPKAKESTLSPEDVDAARERLINTASRKEEVIEKLKEKYLGEGKSKSKKLSKDRVAECVEQVYHKAVEKRLASMAKLEAEYGDFQGRKAPSRKITKEEAKAIGDRLSKKA